MLYDAHCHLSTNVQSLPSCASTVAVECNLMSTNQFDLDYVFELGKLDHINPCFGIHPWYSHLFTFQKDVSKEQHYRQVVPKIDDKLLQALPDPIHLDGYMENLERYLQDSGDTAMIGEVGLDKLFRLPWSGFYGTYGLDKEPIERDGKKLSGYQVSMAHQQDILGLFLKLSLKYKRPVSLHCVKTHGMLLDIIKKHYQDTNIPIALHSYSGSLDHAKSWMKTFEKNVYFSVSKYFNMSRADYTQLIEIVPLANLLLETDFGIDMYDGRSHEADLNDVLESIAEVKGVSKEELQSALTDNWKRFKTQHLHQH